MLGSVTETARQQLSASGTWMSAHILPEVTLLQTRWLLDLVDILPREPRMRLLLPGDRGWIAPCCGALVPGVHPSLGKISAMTATGMATHLAQCPSAREGTFLDSAQLMRRFHELSGAPPIPVNEDLLQAVFHQRQLLSPPPVLAGWDFAVHYSGQSGVSGDFYEIALRADGKILMVLADVAGHGLPAALVVSSALKTVRLLAREILELKEFIVRFSEDVRGDLVPGQFITLFAALLDPATSRLECACAGHHPALIANRDGPILLRRIGQLGPGIGLMGQEDMRRMIAIEAIDLVQGDVLLQYSDGLNEAMDPNGISYGDDRLYAGMLRGLGSNLQEGIDAIVRDVIVHSQGRISDDLTVWAVSAVSD